MIIAETFLFFGQSPRGTVHRFEIFLTADDAKTGFAAPSPPLLCAVSFWFDSFWRSSNLQGH